MQLHSGGGEEHSSNGRVASNQERKGSTASDSPLVTQSTINALAACSLPRCAVDFLAVVPVCWACCALVMCLSWLPNSLLV
jgi:hypothetical protein